MDPEVHPRRRLHYGRCLLQATGTARLLSSIGTLRRDRGTKPGERPSTDPASRLLRSVAGGTKLTLLAALIACASLTYGVARAQGPEPLPHAVEGQETCMRRGGKC